jgi:hypothetical protein
VEGLETTGEPKGDLYTTMRSGSEVLAVGASVGMSRAGAGERSTHGAGGVRFCLGVATG